MAKRGRPPKVKHEKLISPEDFLEQEFAVKSYVPTGSTLLDIAIADKLPGGVASGRVTQIYGGESSAKTAIGIEILGNAQRMGGKAIMVDAEGTFDPRYAKLFGLDDFDPVNWKLRECDSIEDLFDVVIPEAIEFVKDAKGPSMMLIDSLSSLPSDAEIKSKLEDATFGTSRAKQISAGFRKIRTSINANNLGLVFIDQTRMNVGVVFGDKKTTSGGQALKFYASTRILFSHIRKIKNKEKVSVGVDIKFEIKKNKVGKPFRDGVFSLLFDYGIDDTGSLLEWLHDNTPVEENRKNKRWVFQDQVFRDVNELINHVETNNLESKLKEFVFKRWQELYSLDMLARKPKERK